MTLRAVLSQQLLPRRDGPGRVPACEVMRVDGAIRNLIREGKTPQIRNAIQTTGAVGNILMERAVQNLFQGAPSPGRPWSGPCRACRTPGLWPAA